MVTSRALDENDLAIRTDTWVRLVSWILWFGLFPIASEAFGTKKAKSIWWITAALIHAGILHLAGNMVFMLVFGVRVNELIGNLKMAVIYPILAVCSGLIYLFAARNDPLHPSLGASGAIMGLAGMYFVFFPVQKVHMLIWIRFGILRMFYKVFRMTGTQFGSCNSQVPARLPVTRLQVQRHRQFLAQPQRQQRKRLAHDQRLAPRLQCHARPHRPPAAGCGVCGGGTSPSEASCPPTHSSNWAYRSKLLLVTTSTSNSLPK